MDTVTIVGTAASALVITAFYPQVIKSIITRDVKDISLTMYLLSVSGALFWTVYGIATGRPPVIVTNIMVVLPQIVILYLKIKSEKMKWKSMK